MAIILTRTQQKILDVFDDGLRHRREELLAVMNHGSTAKNLGPHILFIRRELRRVGEDLALIKVEGETWYQRVRKLSWRGA